MFPGVLWSLMSIVDYIIQNRLLLSQLLVIVNLLVHCRLRKLAIKSFVGFLAAQRFAPRVFPCRVSRWSFAQVVERPSSMRHLVEISRQISKRRCHQSKIWVEQNWKVHLVYYYCCYYYYYYYYYFFTFFCCCWLRCVPAFVIHSLERVCLNVLELGRDFNTFDDFKAINRQSMTGYDGFVGIPRLLASPEKKIKVTSFPSKMDMIVFPHTQHGYSNLLDKNPIVSVHVVIS